MKSWNSCCDFDFRRYQLLCCLFRFFFSRLRVSWSGVPHFFSLHRLFWPPSTPTPSTTSSLPESSTTASPPLFSAENFLSAFQKIVQHLFSYFPESFKKIRLVFFCLPTKLTKNRKKLILWMNPSKCAQNQQKFKICHNFSLFPMFRYLWAYKAKMAWNSKK